MIKQFEHHDKLVYADESLFGLNKLHCLCYQCALFVPNTPNNCSIAEAVYALDKALNITTPVYECAGYIVTVKENSDGLSIYSKKGTKIIYTGATDLDQVNWGNNDDPDKVLVIGQVYTIDHTEVHSWHTKVYLMEFQIRNSIL